MSSIKTNEDIVSTKKTQRKRRRNRKNKNAANEETNSTSGDFHEDVRNKMFYGGHKTTILSSLDSDRNDEDSYCDITLEVDGQLYPVHKCILGKLSPFFNKMFKTEMREKYDGHATIYGVSEEMIEIILDYVYSATINISDDNVMDILLASDYLQMDEIKRFCVEFLSETMDKSNCLNIQASGELLNCPTLSDTAETMAVQNFEEIIDQQQFKELSKEKAMSFLLSRDQKAFGSKAVYEGVLNWVKYDVKGRKSDFVEFFKLVKLHLLPASYLEEVVANQELVKESHDCKDYFQSELLYRLKLPSAVQQSSKSSENTNEKGQPDSQISSLEGGIKTLNVDGSNLQSASTAPDQRSAPANVTKKTSKAHTSQEQKNCSSQAAASVSRNVSGDRSSTSGNTDITRNPKPSKPCNDVIFSKELVKVLRHGAYKDIKIDSDGFASVDSILAHARFKKICGQRSLKDVRRVVFSSDKKRFELKHVGSALRIRATRGHTIKLRGSQEEQSVGSSFGAASGASYNREYQAGFSGSHNHEDVSDVVYPGDQEVSKELIRILRHGKYKDIQIDSDGYASVPEILGNSRFRRVCGSLTVDDLEYIVETSEKKYFAMIFNGLHWRIRALHGHSIPVENLQLCPISVQNLDKFLYNTVYHLTTHHAWERIQSTGISRMQRAHIQLVSSPWGVLPAPRQNSQIGIEIDMASAIADGIPFFESSDDIILCGGDAHGMIPPEYFRGVTQLPNRCEGRFVE